MKETPREWGKNVDEIIARLRGIPIPTQELEDVLADFVRDELNSLIRQVEDRAVEKEKSKWLKEIQMIEETLDSATLQGLAASIRKRIASLLTPPHEEGDISTPI